MKRENKTYQIGIDAGSTTLKMIVLNEQNEIKYRTYRRHQAKISEILTEELEKIDRIFPEQSYQINLTGSAGMGIAERINVSFVQEVIASIEVINQHYPDATTLIDLGGEDAKMVFFHKNRIPDIRMNGSCAGGTGAFIDQMADLMHISVEELGKIAENYDKIYPVASRCGVFAKTDVQNLISRNVPKADIARSIFHTVALQSITSLARGQEINPKIIFTGGPLTFIPALRTSFQEILQLKDFDIILPENGEYFPAWGAALNKSESSVVLLKNIVERLRLQKENTNKNTLPVLFENEEAYDGWLKSRKIKCLDFRRPLEGEKIKCYLGIDSGSTTTKILAIDENERIVFSFYDKNEGNSLKKVTEGIQKMTDQFSKEGVDFEIIGSTSTGYGEDLIKSALNLDYGIVETLAHLYGARYIDPDVSFILDIGGQDIKSIFIQDGVISNIELNEACSSGCGSFLQNFSSTMNVNIKDFTKAACLSSKPSDLGSRCTVFMNSKVKQSLRENASLGDISAGLAYSVVKNCLFKVLKISNLNKLGDHIVVQGGTFRNDAVYRALELLSEKTVSSTDYPELMGALGAALYAKKNKLENPVSTQFTGKEALPDVDRINTKELECKGCTNKCSVLRFRFDNGNVSYAGNKCEKVFFSKSSAPKKGYNAFEEKNKMLFEKGDCHCGMTGSRIGIPRVLNMFENFPFWNTLFTECGFEVVLSPESTFSLYQRGVNSVMSDNICFPAKVVHGHILALIDEKVDRIFYPMVPKECKETKDSSNSYNCPVVAGYPDVIRSAIDPEGKHGIPFDKPVIPFNDRKALEKACTAYLLQRGIPENRIRKAFKKAIEQHTSIKQELSNKQTILLDRAIKNNELVFIVAGRPYHTDPLIHQKVGQILSDLGATVLTEDVFYGKENKEFQNLNIVSQWSYPNRTVHTALEVSKLPENIQMIQLNSFGCGPDSFFMDEIGEILKQAGKNHTIIRIDEIASPGSIRLRLRSLIESINLCHCGLDPQSLARDCHPELDPGSPATIRGLRVKPAMTNLKPAMTNVKSAMTNVKSVKYERTYQKEDRKKTILAPWFADFISPFIPVIAEMAGYKIVNLPPSCKKSAEIGLKYGHNEVCYPSTLVLGDIIMGLQSGNYDLDDVVVAITQTGGQCRATNYVSQIKSGLKNAGFEHIPVVVAAAGKTYQNEQSAFKVPILKLAEITVYTLLYADALQQMYSSTVIREKKKGEAKELFDFYVEEAKKAVFKNDKKVLLNLLKEAVADFNQIPIHNTSFAQVGLIGEIYVKYNNYGQAYITDWLRAKNMEVVSPPILDFVMQYFVNSEVKHEKGIEKKAFMRLYNPILWKYMSKKIAEINAIAQDYRFYYPSESIFEKAESASEILDLSNQYGEGWSVAAEVASFAKRGINRVVCVQPFGCIANHIVAKGIEKRLKKFYPQMNLLYLDIDGGMAEVNLQNRLHFLINDI
ncbi:acyl-CoA dehydratase activase [Bacteroidales bacterium OttesenSCG-928-A17]|nr:acyl-CoA dehydratase activase [Bacteroidales bacterium OttesenSCG-928-A17]